MESDTKNQVRVGAFLLLGISLAAAMVVYFGRFGDGLRSFYNLRVEYPNASGLFAGADVLLAGAKVGAVQSGPFVLESMRGVYVILKIYDGVLIPEGSTFTIGSAGLLGDSFVDITMPSALDVADFTPIQPDSVVIGGREAGLAGLAEEGERLLTEVRAAIAKVDTVVSRINDEVLAPETLTAVRATVDHIESASKDVALAAKRADGVMERADAAAAEAETAVSELVVALGRATKTVDKSTDTLEAARLAAVSFDKTMADARALIKQIREGQGPIGTLISDQSVSDNLRALVTNLRRHGVLWYRDRATEESAAPPAR